MLNHVGEVLFTRHRVYSVTKHSFSSWVEGSVLCYRFHGNGVNSKDDKTSIEYYCWIKCLNQEKLDLNIALNEWATIFIWLWEYFSNMFFRYCCCSMHTKWTYNIIVTVFMVIADVIFDVIAQCKRTLRYKIKIGKLLVQLKPFPSYPWLQEQL